MNDFYTNVFMQGKFIYTRGYRNGKRYSKTIPYKPYFFLQDNKPSKYKTLDGKPVSRMDFTDVWDAKNFAQKYSDVEGFSIYGMDKWIYTYIHDTFPNVIPYSKEAIKVVYLDIETDSEDGFPDLLTANKKITAITVRKGNQTVSFGYNEFNPPAGVKYLRCSSEEVLLRNFLTLWNSEEWGPDVISGWNIEFFDIPYLVNRITRILGENDAKRLSPWGILRENEVFIKGRNAQVFAPMGIATLDYMQLYKKFTYSEQSSYSLNNICHVELGEKKLDYSEYASLANLYKENHQLFMEYNVRDVDLVVKLEEKLRFIELVFAVAYDAKVNYNDAFTSVLLWDVIIYNYLMDQNIVIPQYKRKPDRAFEGAYVKEPLTGMQNWVMSFDLTSLYPHIIIQYNLSPETFIEKILGIDVEYCLNNPDFSRYAGKSITANGCLFRNDIRGFLPALMEAQFNQRNEYKKLMKAAVKAGNENDISKYDKAQLAKKIQLNSLYGSLSNVWFRYYASDFAEAITLSGQLSIRFIANQVNDYMNRVCKTENEDYIIAIDTDSLYIKFEKFVQLYLPDRERDTVVNALDLFAREKLQPFMEKQYGILAQRMNAHTQAMHMKRENIADKAIWTAKKRYMMNVWDSEGIRYDKPKMKIMGIETVRSSTPEICRKALEKAISITLNGTEAELQRFIKEFKAEFMQAPFDEIARPSTANGLAKYKDRSTIYKLGTPIHVKGALLYNKIVEDRTLAKQNPVPAPIFESDKIKYVYLKIPNPLHDTVIATPGYMPFEELNEYIDYDTQFEKVFVDPLNKITEIIGWYQKQKDSLESLFG